MELTLGLEIKRYLAALEPTLVSLTHPSAFRQLKLAFSHTAVSQSLSVPMLLQRHFLPLSR
jgi:hypothetical protein